MIRSHSTIVGITLFFVLLVYLITQKNYEGFQDIPMPNEIFKKLRGLLDKYDRPDVWNHTIQMANKNPTELARMNLLKEMSQSQGQGLGQGLGLSYGSD